MADFSLTTLFVVPVGQTAVPSSGSTQDLTAGTVGIFDQNYATVTAAGGANPASDAKYIYIAQGRANTYLQGSKRSDKIKGCPTAGASCNSNVTEWYKVSGCATAANQITDVTDFKVQCGEIVTLTLRAHSSYIDTLYFNGFTRSVTVNAPCCECGGDVCTDVDTNALINSLIAKLEQQAPGDNPDNVSFNSFFTFENVGGTTLRIEGKPLTKYGQPCDVAAFPFEYDRMYFSTFVYDGPATTADFIVADACNIVANSAVVQKASYASGGSEEFKQLEKNFYSYQAGYLKSLYRMGGYNENFESYVSDGVVYDSYYIRFNQLDKAAYQWGDYIMQDSTVIIAVPNADTSGIAALIEPILEDALGAVSDDNTCITTTTTAAA
jgi:hypothetical protein|tara:strand:- start:14631 stop:15773 length:1143 start_codon:yes stop_codon:yes gene_type:complete